MTVNLSVLMSASMAEMDYTSPCLFELKHRALVCSWHDHERTVSFTLTRQAKADRAYHQWFTANTSFMDVLVLRV